MLISKAGDDIELHLLETGHAPALLDLEKGWRHKPQIDEPMYPCGSEATIIEFIRSSLSAFNQGKEVVAGIWFQGALAGVIQLRGRIPAVVAPVTATIDYILAPRYRGQGIMTRACRAMIDYAFTTMNFNRVESWIDVVNTKSIGIPERLGLQREGVLRQMVSYGDRFGDIAIYAVLKSEWQSCNA